MKYKITDLMDLYEDPDCLIAPALEKDLPVSNKEAVQVNQTKHKFSWREGLAIAAALAIVILGGIGLKGLLQKGNSPIQSTEVSSQHETNDVIWIYWEDLTGEEKKEYSKFLSIFAEQSVNSSALDLDEDSELIRLAFVYRRLYDPESITVQKDGDTLWDTLTPEQVNETLTKLLGRTVSPKDGKDYSLLRSDPVGGHCSFHDGCFWQEPSGKDFLPRFALATQKLTGEPEFHFDVYAVQIYEWIDWDLRALPSLTQEQAQALENEGKIVKLQTGSAKIRKVDTGLQLVDYRTSDLSNLKHSVVYPLVNPLLTAFAQQGIRNAETDLAGEYELASFAHIYAKVNCRDLISYQTLSGETYETMTLDQVNQILLKLMSKKITPVEGTDYTAQRGDNYAQHETFHDGCFWWGAADGDPHNAFAIGTILTTNTTLEYGRAVLFLSFKVYEPTEPWTEYDFAPEVYLSEDEAEKQVQAGKLSYVADGQAWVRYEDEALTLLGYELIDYGKDSDVDTKSEMELRQELAPLFEDPGSWYARAILGRFATPEQVDLYQMFYIGMNEVEEPANTEKMAAFYARYPEAREYQVGCDVLPTEEIDSVLQQYLGVRLEQTTKKGLSKFTYLDQTDSYYHFHGDTNATGFTIQEIRVQDDGTILFTHEPASWYYPSTQDVSIQTTALKKVNGRYIILSNLPGAWVTGDDVGALSFLYDFSHSWRWEGTDASGVVSVRELVLNEDGYLRYREGDKDSEFSFWQSGFWWTKNSDTICLDLWNTDEIGNRTGEIYIASFDCKPDPETGNLVLTQKSRLGFGTDEEETRLELHVIAWNSTP